MKLVLRLLALLFALPSSYFFLYWALLTFLPIGRQEWIADYGSLPGAILTGWYVWTESANGPTSLRSAIFVGAFMVGGVSFAAGFFGPMIFAPGANQGPLLGLFITGPLGFVLGGIAGAAYWHRHTQAREASPPR
jgi:hypothetical protein